MGLFRSICYCEHTTYPVAAMGEEKKKKKKKKEEKKEPSPPPAEEPAAEGSEKKKSSKKSSKKASGKKLSGPLSCFNEKQLEEFKNGFNLMDQDKDGIISKNDLFRLFDIIGKLADDKELDDLICQSENPLTFTEMLTLFANKMEGAADDDELIIDAFYKFDEGDGTIDIEQFEACLKGKGDPLTDKECKAILPDLPRIDVQPNPHWLSTKGVIELLVSKEEDEEEEEEEAPVQAAA